jgi:UDP-N-acetylmuramate dehydrogenase
MVKYKSRTLRLKKCIKRLKFSVERSSEFSFAKNTTYHCGGVAKLAYLPKNSFEAICAYVKCKQDENGFVVLGNGSNILASDKAFKGSVLCTKKWKGIYRIAPDKIYCTAGTTVSELLQYSLKHSLSGLEFLAGIPATCGGLAYMN